MANDDSVKLGLACLKVDSAFQEVVHFLSGGYCDRAHILAKSLLGPPTFAHRLG
jgi:hypothetical protein